MGLFMFRSRVRRSRLCSTAMTVATVVISPMKPAFADQSQTSGGDELQEIVVTAEKRSERLTDVPEAVSVIGSDVLEKRDVNQLDDFFRFVPGVSFSSNGQAFSQLSMRGITTGGLSGSTGNTPTVAIYMDDVPLNSSTALSLGDTITPDLDPSDLDHIEVLKGPQGTLYGASTLGGLLKYSTKLPDLTQLTGRAEATGDWIFGHDPRLWRPRGCQPPDRSGSASRTHQLFRAAGPRVYD